MRRPDICLLILAAGASRRFGGDKRCAILPNGRSVLEQALAIAEAGGTACRLVVREDDKLADERAECLYVAHAERGMGRSIAEAVVQLPLTINAALLMPVDLACLSPKTITAIAKKAEPTSIVRPRCDGRFGHPVAFGRNFFAELADLDGDSGARSVIAAHPECVEIVDVADAGIYRDIDTPAALAAMTSDDLF